MSNDKTAKAVAVAGTVGMGARVLWVCQGLAVGGVSLSGGAAAMAVAAPVATGLVAYGVVKGGKAIYDKCTTKSDK